MKLNKTTKSTLVALAGLALITASANAAVTVNYNFGSADATTLVGPAGGATETWNQGNGTDTDLVDSAGVPTGINVTLSNASNLFTSSGATLSMLVNNYWVTGSGNILTVTVPDISKTYDLYLASYIDYQDADFASSHSTINVTTNPGPQLIAHTPSDHVTWARGTNYVLFEGMVPNASGELIIDNPIGTVGPNGVMALNGFQLVETVPEPSTTALLGLGGLALVFRRRK